MLRVIECFAGIGSAHQALKNIGINHEVVAISEIDKYANTGYFALHGEKLQLGDITKVEKLPLHDLLIFGFPCQDISRASAGLGLEKGSKTRSSLLWEVERLLLQAQSDGSLPKYLLMENVKNLLGHKHKANFEKWLAFLSGLGYSNYYKVLNAKNYGIPQNRERIFCVSILGEHKPYEFPKPVELKLRLKDMLEPNVDEKYYLTDVQVEQIINSNYDRERRRILIGDVSSCLAQRDYKSPRCVVVGSLNTGKWKKMHDISKRIHSPEGLCPCISTFSGGNTEIKVIAGQFQPVDRDYKAKGLERKEQFECRKDDVANAVLTGDKKNCVLESKPYSDLVYFGFHKKNQQGNRVYDSNGISATITARGGCKGGNGGGLYVCGSGDSPCDTGEPVGSVEKEVVVYDDYNSRIRSDSDTIGTITTNIGSSTPRNAYKIIEKEVSNTVRVGGRGSLDRHQWDLVGDEALRIRKLTPTECLSLMGWNNEQISKLVASGLSNTRLYRSAGNGIVIQTLEAIFRQLFKGGAYG